MPHAHGTNRTALRRALNIAREAHNLGAEDATHGHVAQADPGEESEDDGIPRGIWQWNGVEWRWTPAAKQIPEDILECRIMLRFPASTGYKCTKAERKLWHQKIWETLIPQHTEVSYQTQIAGARSRLCAEQWQQIH